MANRKPHSEEAKRRMSESRKRGIAEGRIKIHNKGDSSFGEEWRDKTTPKFLEFARSPKSEEHKRKIGESLKGREVSRETRSKISAKMSGPLNWNWKNGESDPNIGNVRNSIEYRAWRKAVFERDGFRCLTCGTNRELQADHIKQFAYYPELRFDVSNGRTLCKKHHKEVTRLQAAGRKKARALALGCISKEIQDGQD